MEIIEQAVILAGGKGTRMAPFTDTKPKPMFEVNGIPFIERLILQVKEFGIEKVVLLLGYLPQIIVDCLGNGERFGLQITYDITPEEYDTGSRIAHANAKGMLEDSFLFLYCDNYCPIDFKKHAALFEKTKAQILLTVYENADSYTRSNLKINSDGCVEKYDKKRNEKNLAGVDIGYACIRKEVLKYLPDNDSNFEAAVYPKVVEKGKMYAVITKHRYYSIGSWERIELTEQFFSEKKTVFLDRDGTINVRAPKACYIETPKQFIWLAGAREAIKLLNDKDYRVLLVSNQPGIARGNLTEEILGKIHQKMQSELQEIGAHIDDIYYCPHNWEEGCECRKPKPGMLYQAQKEYSLDLTKCIMVGDDDRDMEAGNSAGCKCIQITEDYSLLQAVKDIIGGRE